MTPEKAERVPKEYMDRLLTEMCGTFDKRLGRLKLVEEMMRQNAVDMEAENVEIGESGITVDAIGAFFASDHYADMLSELQSVIAEIEREMKG